MIRKIFCRIAFILTLVAVPAVGTAQVIPPEIQRELARNNLTEAQARALALRLGIDLNDPVAAAQRARELGVSETIVQRLLRAVSPTGEEDLEAVDSAFRDSLLFDTLDESELSRQAERSRAARDSINASERPSASTSAAVDSLPYFGYDLFRSVPDAFEPSPLGPVDEGYLVGPGDELRLSVWGAAEFQYTLPVDAEGRIFVERVGQITVAGKRLDALREDVMRTLSRSYAGLLSDPPTVFMDLTVARLRPIKVFVLGEVGRPGGYTVASASTPFSVLYSMGGPLLRGSLRQIDVVRNGRVVSTLDLYDYLLKGAAGNPIRLRNNDFVFVRARGKTVSIAGDVVRPGIYELADGETFSTLLDFSGGLNATAYARRFQIERIVPFAERADPSIARRLIDADLADVLAGRADVDLFDGDAVSIFSISDRVDNAVRVSGAVFQAGRYELTPDLRTVRDLLRAADGLTEDAFMGSATLVRLRDDLSQEQITLDLSGVLSDEPSQNIALVRLDSLVVYSKTDVQDPGEVEISGHVRTPRVIPWRENLQVSDLLFEGGGLHDTLFVKTVFLERADLFRLNEDGITTRVIPFHLGFALEGGGLASERLRPGDEIRIYPREVGRLSGDRVYVSGAVRNPGEYPYREELTLEDLILQAGGFTPSAYLESADVSRNVYGEQQIAETMSVPLVSGAPDRSVASPDRAVSALFTARSVRLEPDDRVYIRTDPNLRPQETVLVSGEVRFPGQYAIEHENETLQSIMRRAGGVLPTGYRAGTRLIRNSQPVIADFDRILSGDGGRELTVLPGDQVFVPRSPNTVEVRGNVNNPGLLVYEKGDRVRNYIDRAGGLAPESADIFVTQADGATFKLRRGLFPTNPRVDEGGVISVTQKPPKEPGERTDVGKIITDTVGVLGTVLTAIILATKL